MIMYFWKNEAPKPTPKAAPKAVPKIHIKAKNTKKVATRTSTRTKTTKNNHVSDSDDMSTDNDYNPFPAPRNDAVNRVSASNIQSINSINSQPTNFISSQPIHLTSSNQHAQNNNQYFVPSTIDRTYMDSIFDKFLNMSKEKDDRMKEKDLQMAALLKEKDDMCRFAYDTLMNQNKLLSEQLNKKEELISSISKGNAKELVEFSKQISLENRAIAVEIADTLSNRHASAMAEATKSHNDTMAEASKRYYESMANMSKSKDEYYNEVMYVNSTLALNAIKPTIEPVCLGNNKNVNLKISKCSD